MAPGSILDLRACWSTYLGLCFGPAILMVVAMFAAPRSASILPLIPICALIILAVTVWLRSLRIELTTETLKYSTFRRTAEIRLADIGDIHFESQLFRKPRHKSQPALVLSISSRDVGKQTIEINANVFCREDIVSLLDEIQRTTHGPSIEVPKSVVEFMLHHRRGK